VKPGDLVTWKYFKKKLSKIGIVLKILKVEEFEEKQVTVHWFNAGPHHTMPNTWPIGTDLLEVINESR
jgi:hypothetical protein